MKFSVVIPVYNEAAIIPILKSRLENVVKALPGTTEIVVVNDGSQDDTADKVKAWIKENKNVVLLELSRNFGHQAAITAGLREATGDAVIILDADLQDPPELIPEMVEKWQAGYKIVLAERKSRGEGLVRKFLFQSFYKIFAVLTDIPPVTSGVFGLMDKTVARHLASLSEQNRFIPGLRNWVGFKSTTIWYHREPRVGGEPKQSFARLVKYGLDAIFSFSYKPLRISFAFGLIISSLCFLYATVLIVLRMMDINLVSGFTTTAVAIFFLGGVILISNGILGEYLGRIYDEVKQRPLYIVAQKTSRENDSPELKTVERP